jgi:hypothetical protein
MNALEPPEQSLPKLHVLQYSCTPQEYQLFMRDLHKILYRSHFVPSQDA